ncbi:hypothetical protein R5R35_008743 [Gryllus longicercus]|uniref:SANTA domain-containing protein n=1 Tax=Gryllus longicercus TaxID=2509291 RepID=A0AAN9VML4_9ORTH
MCPSSNLRCGSCLSKWNGKSWEETYKCVLPIKSWSLMLNKKYQLCVEGLCDINSDLAVCIPITDRLNSYWVSNDCTLVKLHGILNTKELPEYVAEKFARGVPTNWKEIVNKWIQYVQRGEKSSFTWEQDESFGSCDTSFLLTRSRRIISGRKSDGNSKGKSIQRTAGKSRCSEEERDSAFPTSEDCSGAKVHQPGSPPSIWGTVSPQLPAYKVKEIFQWIDTAHLSNEPSEREVEDGIRNTRAEFVAPSEPVFNPKNRVPNSETIHRKTNNIMQSTPVSGSALIDSEGFLPWNVSSVHSTINNSATLGSVASDIFGKSDLRNQPKKNSKNISRVPPSRLLPVQENIEVPASVTSSDPPLVKIVSDSVFREPTRGEPPKTFSKTLPGKVPRNSKNAEMPGSQMGRMLSSSLRPRRKQTLQKIERWRPVLGVDGSLKVQGYLLLQSDMTAGQILTTNSVVKWGERRVITCDGREYELVGDPYGKIPDDLKNQLLKPLDYSVITAKLMEFQAVKEDVTSCFYLAPPPAPMTMSMTRSGRVCRPVAPYWLNRSDWGAEYDLFYGNVDNEKSGDKTTNRSSRSTHNVRNNKRTTSRNTSLGKQKSNSTLTCNMQETSKCVMETPSSSRLRGTIRKNTGSGSSTGLNSETSPRIQRNTSNTPGLNLSANNRSSNKVDLNSSNLRSSQIIHEKASGPAIDSNNIANNQQDKENNFIGKSNTDATRSCFENITWKSTQNQMMMPSPRLCADSSNVDYSSSRIKVSYMTSETKTMPKNLQNSSEFDSRSSRINESFSSSEYTPKSRPSRSPSKRACLPCLQDSKTNTTSHSPRSPLSRTRRQTIPEKTSTQAISPSPVRCQTETSPLVEPQTPSRKKLSLLVNKKRTVRKQNTRQSLLSSSPGTSVASSPRRKKTEKTTKILPSPKSLRSTTRTTSRQLRVLVRRLDARKSFQNDEKLTLPRKSTSSQSQRKSLTNEIKKFSPKEPKRNVEGKNVSAAKKIPEKKPVEVTKKTKRIMKNRKDEVNKNKDDEVKNQRDQAKKIKRVEKKEVKRVGVKNKKKDEEMTKKEEEKNKSKKRSSTKTIPTSSEEITEDDGSASDCSSDSSVGPSASVIFQLNNPPEPRRKPRTLKERRERDAQLAEMGKKLAAKETVGIDADDDPMANLIASHKFSPLPQEWCRHENLLGKSRKRRRPSSSDGTVSPSRSGLDDGFGNEDATSSVATPQLLMRPPDPKQVQSYLQRQRQWNAKPQRPTRQSKKSNDNLSLPHIDYAAVFRPDISDSEECSSEVSDSSSDWVA